MTERDLIFLCCGSLTACAIFVATTKACDFFAAYNSTGAQIERQVQRRLRDVERRRIRAVILGGAVK